MKALFVYSANNSFPNRLSPIIKNQAESLINEGMVIDYFGIIGTGILGYLSNVSRLRNKIQSFNPDIVHAHYAFTGFIASFSSNKPVVVSLMGSDIINKKITICLIRIIGIFFWKAIIVKSMEMKIILKMSNKVIVIPNGIDLDHFKPEDSSLSKIKLGWDSNVYHILFAGNPAKKAKNYNLALRAVSLLGSEKIQIHHVANIPHEKMPLHLNASDIILLTSISEGSPNVIKEAIACNRPVISTNVGDVEEYLSEIENCYICDYDPLDISEKIKLILKSSGVSSGREKVIIFDKNIIARKIIAQYHDTIA